MRLPHGARAAVVMCAVLLGGCGRDEPRILYAYLVMGDGPVEAVMVCDRSVRPGTAADIVFTPPPTGAYSVHAGARDNALSIRFEEPAPFPAGERVRVAMAGGEARLLVDGTPYPRLRAVRWHDVDADGVVDSGDLLELEFSAPVELRAPGGELPAGEFILPGGRDQLSRASRGGVRVRAGPGPMTVTLELGEGVFFRPGSGGESECSTFGLNATFAAPSRWIRSRASGLGAVSPVFLPIVRAGRDAPFRHLGRIGVGPAGANLGSSVSYCAAPEGAYIVIAGGFSRAEGTRLVPAADVFVCRADAPETLFASGTLTTARVHHTALALPVPPDCPVKAAVLFLGGYGPDGAALTCLDLVCVREAGPLDPEVVTSEDGMPLEIVARWGASAVYVPESERMGLVVVAGGETLGVVELLRVAWPEGARRPVLTAPALERAWRHPFLANRSGHTMTAVALADGDVGVFLFGGEIVGSPGIPTVALPQYLFPVRAARHSAAAWFFTGFGNYGETALKRQGHRAAYVPGSETIMLVGGEIRAGIRDWNPPPVMSVVEFDVPRGIFVDHPVFGVRVEPEVVALPCGEAVLVCGGRDEAGEYLSTCDVYAAGADGLRVRAFGGFLPDGAQGARAFLDTTPQGAPRVLLVGGKAFGVWEGPLWSNAP